MQLSVAQDTIKGVDTIYLVDVSGSMVEDLRRVITKEVHISSWYNLSPRQQSAVVRFLQDPRNHHLLQANLLYKYTQLLEKEIDGYQKGTITLITFSQGPYDLDGDGPMQKMVETYVEEPDSSKKLDLKRFLEPARFGEIAGATRWHGVVAEAVLHPLGSTWINASCERAMGILEERVRQYGYTDRTRLQRLWVLTDGQESNRLKTFPALLERFKAQRERIHFEYYEEYCGREKLTKDTQEMHRQLRQADFRVEICSRRIIVFGKAPLPPDFEDGKDVLVKDGAPRGVLGQFELDFSQVEHPAGVHVRVTSSPPNVAYFESTGSSELEVRKPVSGDGRVPFAIRAKVPSGLQQASVTLHFTPEPPDLEVKPTQLTLETSFRWPNVLVSGVPSTVGFGSIRKHRVTKGDYRRPSFQITMPTDLPSESAVSLSLGGTGSDAFKLVRTDTKEEVAAPIRESGTYTYAVEIRPQTSIGEYVADLTISMQGDAFLLNNQTETVRVPIKLAVEPAIVKFDWLERLNKPELGTLWKCAVERGEHERLARFHLEFPRDFPQDGGVALTFDGNAADAFQVLKQDGAEVGRSPISVSGDFRLGLRTSGPAGTFSGKLVLTAKGDGVQFANGEQSVTCDLPTVSVEDPVIQLSISRPDGTRVDAGPACSGGVDLGVVSLRTGESRDSTALLNFEIGVPTNFPPSADVHAEIKGDSSGAFQLLDGPDGHRLAVTSQAKAGKHPLTVVLRAPCGHFTSGTSETNVPVCVEIKFRTGIVDGDDITP